MARILVVDDEAEVRRTIGRMLATAGHDVVSAATGREAQLVLDQTKPDIIIVDILMPEQDGIELIGTLRRGNTGVKILAISGGGQLHPHDLLLVARKLGAEAVLAKPFQADELLAAIDSLRAASGA